MQSKLGLWCRVGVMSLLVGSAVVACGDDENKKPSSSNAGGETAGGEGNDGPSSSDGGADSTPSGGRGSTGSGGRGGTKNDPGDPVQPSAGGGGDDAPDFDGIDLSDVPEDTAPGGCVGGFDPELGSLTLEVGGDASSVVVAVVDGVVHANGVACESAKGDPASADAVITLDISGGAGDEQLFLDLSQGAFEGCFSADGAIHVALGEGDDTFSLLGTQEADDIQAGTEEGALAIDVTADQRVDVVVEGTPKVVVSTAARNDVVRGDGAALGLEPAQLALWLYGGGAGDELVGGAADDELFGGIGNDWLDAGSAPAGADSFDGGDGNDTIDFSARTEPLTLTLGAGADDGEEGENADIADSVEDVIGGQAENDITGGPASNHIWGGPKVDRLVGGAGDDILIGNASGDTLSGDAGNDTLYGEEGDDQLSGGADDDLLDGGDGKDSLDAGAGDGDICIISSDTVKACEL